LFVGIGILGFSPFATAFVFWRCAIRAYPRQGHDRVDLRWSKPAVVAIGLIVSCGGPWAAQEYVDHKSKQAIAMFESADPDQAKQGLSVLKQLHVVVSFDQIVFAYEKEQDASRHERLAAAYKHLTGEEIEHRLRTLRD
jgi:hypothetical protein